MSNVSIKNGLSVALRPYDHGRDDGFVIRSWVMNFARSRMAEPWPDDEFNLWRKDYLYPTLASSRTIIAHHPEEPRSLLGWICADAAGGRIRVHGLYVKQAFRRLGIAHALLTLVTGNHSADPLPFVCWSRKLETDGRLRRAFTEKYRAFWNPYAGAALLDEI